MDGVFHDGQDNMKVTQVSIRPSEASDSAGRPSLTPELLAASGARYSRNNEGLEAILSRIDPKNLDKSVDSIFRMVDYGHQSIADMVPVAMFIDEISIWLAYYLWTLCPMAGGQESSTRYIKISDSFLLPPGELGVPIDKHAEWRKLMKSCFEAYLAEVAIWEKLSEADPELTHIPRSLLEDSSNQAKRQVARMKRNFAFDRSRYFLPVAASTNAMLVMSARNWVQLCQVLLAHFLPEATRLGKLIKSELELCAPRLVRHAEPLSHMAQGINSEFEVNRSNAASSNCRYLSAQATTFDHPVNPALEVFTPPEVGGADLSRDLRFHENRYAWIGANLRRVVVRFSWEAVALAEIRDLNRHRTGNKYCPLIPRGFYCAMDQLPSAAVQERIELHRLADVGREASRSAVDLLSSGDHSYIYWSLLGTQYSFEHVTTGDKFVYEAELRTGTGAHFRYASHVRDVLSLWYKLFPETRGFILEGSAEPE